MELGLKISTLTNVFVLFLVAFLSLSSAKKIKDATMENCEVCVTFLGKFIDSLEPDAKGDQAKIETAFRKMCKTAKKDDNRLCYYVGGTDDAATSTIGELTKPISWGVPADKVCMKLYRKDEQICDLKYEKQIDLTNINLKKLKVRELKQILSDWEDQCRGCTEKTDFIKRIEELMPIHAPEAHAKRQKKSEL